LFRVSLYIPQKINFRQKLKSIIRISREIGWNGSEVVKSVNVAARIEALKKQKLFFYTRKYVNNQLPASHHRLTKKIPRIQKTVIKTALHCRFGQKRRRLHKIHLLSFVIVSVTRLTNRLAYRGDRLFSWERMLQQTIVKQVSPAGGCSWYLLCFTRDFILLTNYKHSKNTKCS
tara:strand:+ start:412 stop:933 length:522 start_codon:yes stop_codon:yes gene_type:complete